MGKAAGGGAGGGAGAGAGGRDGSISWQRRQQSRQLGRARLTGTHRDVTRDLTDGSACCGFVRVVAAARGPQVATARRLRPVSSDVDESASV